MDLSFSELPGNWFTGYYVELPGAVLGIVYIILSVRQNILTWPAGIATSVLYVFVFYQSRFYAGMGLQVYYVAISIYGWYFWLKGKKPAESEQVPVTTINRKQLLGATTIFLFCFAGLYLLLSRFTDSPVPFMDSLTTALSIVATWLLARKVLENWLIWIVTDLASAGLYITKNLWPTTVLFLIYTTLAFMGYHRWKKSMLQPL